MRVTPHDKYLPGVLDHIKSETYRRKTAVYEEIKLADYSDIWNEGVLVNGD